MDDPRTVAFDPRAPQNERTDALAQLQSEHRPLSSALIPADDLKETIAFINDGFEETEMMKSKVINFPSRQRPPGKRGMQSLYLDDQQINIMGDYWDRPALIDFDGLRQVVDQTPVLSAVVMTRIRQICRFTQPSEDGGPGFEIRHIDRKHKLTPAEQESTNILNRFFQHCGFEFVPRKRKLLKRDNFTQFMSKLVRDSLTMDSCGIEVEWKRDRGQGIDGLYAIDGSTIRLCSDDGYQGDDAYHAVQVVQGRIMTAYKHGDLIYEPRNPRSDVRVAGYGLSEVELMIRVVTGFLNAMSYNIAGFDKNTIPKGLLHLSGDYSKEDMSAFKRYWNSMVKGTNNAWNLPVLVSKDQESKASFEKFGVDFDEMYFSKWMTFLTSIICAIYGMSPDEINFESFSAQKSSMSGSDTAEKLADSKDKGLRPLMSYFESMFSDFVVSEFSDKYCFRWVGLDEEDDAKAWEAQKLILTVNELRAERGYEAMEGPLGEAPINPSLISPWMQLNAPPQQGADFGGQQPGPDFGDGGGEDGDGGQPEQGEPQDQQQPADQDEQPAAPGGDFGGGGSGGDFGKALMSRESLFPSIFRVEA